MKKIFDQLAGEKTYIIAFAAAIYSTGVGLNLWPHMTWLDLLLGSAATATIRHGISTEVSKALDDPTLPPTPPPTPAGTGSGTLAPIVQKAIALALFTTSLALGLVACAHINPKANKFVVAVERFQGIAGPTFDTFLKLDAANTSFFITKAPEAHKFAEYLRDVVIVDGTNQVVRYNSYLLSLEKTKLAYKHGRASSNELFTIFTTVQTAFNQSTNYISLVPTH